MFHERGNKAGSVYVRVKRLLNMAAIKDVIKKYNIHPSKRLGQNFLIDKNVCGQIIRGADICKDDVVLEIGTGLGALTNELCLRAKKVISIEKDKRLFNIAKKTVTAANLQLEEGDILCYNFKDNAKVKVIGNLPYYISSPILSYLICNRQFIDEIFITVQKEFAERVTAKPGTKAYSSISCYVQFYTEPAILFTIKKSAFYPAPKVDSSFLKMRVRDKGPFLTDEEKFFKIIRACFSKRRKTILNSLSSGINTLTKKELAERFDAAGIDFSRRPETISLEEFAVIANIL